MWESPINQILGELQMHLEGETLKAVQNVGIDVDKEELIKALQYDRGQYEKGYKDGYEKAIDEFAVKLKNFMRSNVEDAEYFGDCCCEIYESEIDEIAEWLKGVRNE